MESDCPELVVLLPVYNGSPEYIDIALRSAERTGLPVWIFDDASPDASIATLLSDYASQRPGVHYHRQPENRGLFGNLNHALRSVRAKWFLILCSDDELLPSAAATAQKLIAAYPQCDLILSEFVAIDGSGKVHPSGHGEHLREIRPTAGIVERQRAIESVLRLGSFNGNITGMLISADGAKRLPAFREDWRQASDWLWLANVCRFGTVAIAFESLARVRLHDQKLSATNFRNGIAISEELTVVRMLSKLPELQTAPARKWTRRLASEFLWRSLRLAASGQYRAAWMGILDVQETAGLVRPSLKVAASLPARLRRRLNPSEENRSRPIQE